ncbi:MAG: GTPase Era [Clostridia bacterium]|nr:GTPase Era [Clostridia bacterium]
MFKTGYISVVGKPNAGKSTLVNQLVGFKVAITTPKPQTTRFNIKGIITTETSQMIFTDTPGIHKPKNKLGEYMMKGVANSINCVDVIIYMVDATKPRIDTTSEKIMEDMIATKSKVILAINKIDKVEKSKILTIMSEYNSYMESIGGKFCEIIPISIYKQDGLDVLVQNIEKYLPEGERIYSEDEITDISEKDIIEEIIREKALNNLEEEVPHGIIVEVEKFKKRKNIEKKSVYDIDVNIICEKTSHKAIIIGKEGAMLKKIGTEARREIEHMLEDKVNLKLWVKVRQNWQESDIYLNNIKNKMN